MKQLVLIGVLVIAVMLVSGCTTPLNQNEELNQFCVEKEGDGSTATFIGVTKNINPQSAYPVGVWIITVECRVPGTVINTGHLFIES